MSARTIDDLLKRLSRKFDIRDPAMIKQDFPVESDNLLGDDPYFVQVNRDLDGKVIVSICYTSDGVTNGIGLDFDDPDEAGYIAGRLRHILREIIRISGHLPGGGR